MGSYFLIDKFFILAGNDRFCSNPGTAAVNAGIHLITEKSLALAALLHEETS
jgi:hypothetical protein